MDSYFGVSCDRWLTVPATRSMKGDATPWECGFLAVETDDNPSSDGSVTRGATPLEAADIVEQNAALPELGRRPPVSGTGGAKHGAGRSTTTVQRAASIGQSGGDDARTSSPRATWSGRVCGQSSRSAAPTMAQMAKTRFRWPNICWPPEV
jgi:hypothetical protein